MNSMTGFGQATFQKDGLNLTVSIKAVNGRFFEFKPHLPRDYFPLEAEVKRQVAQYLCRGTVDVYVSRKSLDDSAHKELVIQYDAAKKWVDAYQKLCRHVKTSGDFSLQTAVAQQGFISFSEEHEISKKEQQQFYAVLAKALKSCVQEQKREGLALAKDISSKLDGLEKLSKQMFTVRKDANQLLRKKIETKWKKLDFQEPLDEQRVIQEIVFQVDKSDISEEMSRLKEHISRMKTLLKSKDGTIGKKLDFYTQELLREINTIGSKSSLSNLTEMVVDAKALIEQVREQVQNIQ